MSKKRSGLANDRRAYKYACCPPPIKPTPTFSGQIVGYGTDPDTGNHYGLFWSSPSAIPVKLDSGGYNFIQAFGINRLGQIVGVGFNDKDLVVGLFWSSPSAKPVKLSSPFSLNYIGDINNLGQISGFTNDKNKFIFL
jgi:hypothetical protein